MPGATERWTRSVARGTPDTRDRNTPSSSSEMDSIFNSYHHYDTQLLRERKHSLYSI